MDSEVWRGFFVRQLWRLPHMALFIVGIILSAVSWRRHPRASLLALIAFCVLLGGTLIGIGFNLWLQTAMRRGSFDRIQPLLMAMSVLRGLLNLGGWTLIMFAIFGRRKQAITAAVVRLPPGVQPWVGT